MHNNQLSRPGRQGTVAMEYLIQAEGRSIENDNQMWSVVHTHFWTEESGANLWEAAHDVGDDFPIFHGTPYMFHSYRQARAQSYQVIKSVRTILCELQKH